MPTIVPADTDFIEVLPRNGYLVHALKPVLDEDGNLQQQSRDVWGRTLCGVRGRDGWGLGGMRARLDEGRAVPFDSDARAGAWSEGSKRVYSNRCPKCRAAVRKARAGAGE